MLTIKEIANLSMEVITYAGNARSSVYEALDKCIEGDFDQAEACLKNSQHELLRAHKLLAELVSKEAKGEKIPVNILFVHAQDILMIAMAERDLVKKLVEFWKKSNRITSVPQKS